MIAKEYLSQMLGILLSYFEVYGNTSEDAEVYNKALGAVENGSLSRDEARCHLRRVFGVLDHYMDMYGHSPVQAKTYNAAKELFEQGE